MFDGENVIFTICNLLKSDSALVLASIVSLQGSSPRHMGTKMVIGADGKTYGTIGGSLLEATAVKEAKAVLSQCQSKYMYFDLLGDNAASAGMICGGKVVVLLDYLNPTPENQEFFRSLCEAVSSCKDFYLLTQVKSHSDALDVAGRYLLYPDGQISGCGQLTNEDVSNLKSELHNISATTVMAVQDTSLIIDPFHKIKTVYCFGAGHVAVPTAHIAALTGFRVVVLDDRSEYASAARFPEASEILVIDDFNQAFTGLHIDADSFIVILTRGHQYDREVLEQALKTKARYIGMISSRRKRDAIYQALTDQGVKGEELARVHSPIGIAIGGETPEEIAVSIVAEMIKERVGQSN